MNAAALMAVGADGAKSDDIEPRKVLKEELAKLQTDYVDLCKFVSPRAGIEDGDVRSHTDLIHNPFYTGDRTLAETWAILEDLVKEGLTKSIGVSNFREEDLIELEKTWKDQARGQPDRVSPLRIPRGQRRAARRVSKETRHPRRGVRASDAAVSCARRAC